MEMSIYSRVPPLPALLNKLMDVEIKLEMYHRQLGIPMFRDYAAGSKREEIKLAVELIYQIKFLCTRIVKDFCCTPQLPSMFISINLKLDRLDNVMKMVHRQEIPFVYKLFM